jgi:thiol-disulfide isomerase/thioredoxin
MRVISCMIVLVLCTTFTGCSLFKKNTNTQQGPANPNGAPPAKFPGAPDPLLNSDVSATPKPPPPAPPPGPQSSNGGKAVLAGTVKDGYGRSVGNAYIRLVNGAENEAGPPVDVATDTNGHFFIQGLKTGQQYKLIARTKQGEKMLAGVQLTDAPNVHVVIRIREEWVTSTTPPIPGTPAYQKGAADGVSKNTDPAPASKGWGLWPTKPAPEPNLPATMNVPAAPVAAPVGNAPNNAPIIAANPKDALPLLNIPGKSTTPNLPIDPPRPLPSGDSKLDTGPTRVPSCVLLGNHLENLALKDTKGQTWEYKKQAYGKLVLVDFWFTSCMPCRDSMPKFNRLHKLYGSRGLEVIGIAIEKEGDERKDAAAVNKVCASMQISYRQLLGRSKGADASKDFDASKIFKVTSFPTLMLIDEQGNIVYQAVSPDPGQWVGLERTIQARLANRGF